MFLLFVCSKLYHKVKYKFDLQVTCRAQDEDKTFPYADSKNSITDELLVAKAQTNTAGLSSGVIVLIIIIVVIIVVGVPVGCYYVSSK